MEFTGERFVPEVQGNIELEHIHRYLQACELVSGKVVLDIASGEGYGSALLAGKAAHVIGVDISEDAVNHASKRYTHQNLKFIVGNCLNIPLPDASVDVVVSFETIEHHDQHETMIREIKRVLTKTGVLLISSPDKYFYSEKPKFDNCYHVKELYQHEFKKLISDFFKKSIYFQQRVIYGSAILSEAVKSASITYTKENDKIELSSGLAKPIFWIALASDVDLPELTIGLYEQPVEDSELARWMEKELLSAINLVKQKDASLAVAEELLKQKDASLAVAEELLKQKDASLAVAEELLKLKDEHLATAAELIHERDQLLTAAHAKLARSIQLPWKK